VHSNGLEFAGFAFLGKLDLLTTGVSSGAPKFDNFLLRFKTWYANVMKLASSLSHTPCGAMPGAPASKDVEHTRHHRSVKLTNHNTLVLTHTNYYYTKPCTDKCNVVKRSISSEHKIGEPTLAAPAAVQTIE
jgi:hypothetical protein